MIMQAFPSFARFLIKHCINIYRGTCHYANARHRDELNRFTLDALWWEIELDTKRNSKLYRSGCRYDLSKASCETVLKNTPDRGTKRVNGITFGRSNS